MTLSRRGFLRLLGAAAPAIVAPTYFLPPIGGWHSGLIVNPADVNIPIHHADFLIPDDEVSVASSTSSLSQACATYYSKRFVENLKHNLSLKYLLITPKVYGGGEGSNLVTLSRGDEDCFEDEEW